MKTNPNQKWKWVKGQVDIDKDHIKISYDDDPKPLVLIAPPKRNEFVVQFLLDEASATKEQKAKIDDVIVDLDYFLIELGERDPWAYAKYHCSTAANVYSKVHWSYYPKG